MMGSKCKCGFATTSTKTKCPRCGKEMKTSEWDERGKVLSFVELRIAPKVTDRPYNMALVEIENDGPKVICWTTDTLKDNDEVLVNESDGRYTCSPISESKRERSKAD